MPHKRQSGDALIHVSARNLKPLSSIPAHGGFVCEDTPSAPRPQACYCFACLQRKIHYYEAEDRRKAMFIDRLKADLYRFQKAESELSHVHS